MPIIIQISYSLQLTLPNNFKRFGMAIFIQSDQFKLLLTLTIIQTYCRPILVVTVIDLRVQHSQNLSLTSIDIQ